MLMFGLRLGTNPRAVVTTTPRPTKLIRELVSRTCPVRYGRGLCSKRRGRRSAIRHQNSPGSWSQSILRPRLAKMRTKPALSWSRETRMVEDTCWPIYRAT
jgi:hypothetical protein